MDSNKKLFLELLQTKALKINLSLIWVEEDGDCINSRQSLSKTQVVGNRNHSRNMYTSAAKVAHLLKNTLKGRVDPPSLSVLAFKARYFSKRRDGAATEFGICC